MIHLKPMGTPGKCPAHERAWTPEEEELVISLYRKKSLTEIAALLPAPGRSADAVAHKLQFLRERFPDQIGYMRPRYTQEQDNFIRKNCRRRNRKSTDTTPNENLSNAQSKTPGYQSL
ncbi:hypothetical protein JJC88_002390 [Salmonella enterica]|nr:hypothetical protein [Salmonella enterica]